MRTRAAEPGLPSRRGPVNCAGFDGVERDLEAGPPNSSSFWKTTSSFSVTVRPLTGAGIVDGSLSAQPFSTTNT